MLGKPATVMEESVTKDECLVLSKAKSGEQFLFMIEAEDTIAGSFLPVIKVNGKLEIVSDKDPISELFAEVKKQMPGFESSVDLLKELIFKKGKK